MEGRLFKTSKFILLVISVVFLYSCSNHSNDIAAFKVLNEGLVNSNKVIDRSNETIYHSFQDKLTDPLTAEKAKIWYPKTETVRELSKDLTNYIEGLKTNVREEAALQNKDANDLYSRLIDYKKNLMQIDSEMTAEFKSNLILTNSSFDSIQNNQKDFAKTFFHSLSGEGTISLLSKFQNNIKVNENKLLMYCLFKIQSVIIDGYDWLSVFVSQNTSYLKSGDKVEITAGVGAFSQRALPEIIIGGKKIPIDVTGVAIASFKAPNKPGKHFVPVEVSYTDQDGKKQTITRTIEYTVLEN